MTQNNPLSITVFLIEERYFDTAPNNINNFNQCSLNKHQNNHQSGTSIESHINPFTYVHLLNNKEIMDTLYHLMVYDEHTWLKTLINESNSKEKNYTDYHHQHTSHVLRQYKEKQYIKYYKIMQTVSGFSNKQQAHEFCAEWKSKSRSMRNRIIFGLELINKYKSQNPNIFPSFVTSENHQYIGENHPSWVEHIEKLKRSKNLNLSLTKMKNILYNCVNCKCVEVDEFRFITSKCKQCENGYIEINIDNIKTLNATLSNVKGTKIFCDNQFIDAC